MNRRILCVALLAILIGCGSDTPTETETELTARYARVDPVQFSTPDGFLLRGSLFSPSDQQTPLPVVILLHPFNQDHTAWFAYVSDIVLDRNFIALAFDMRGHGSSLSPSGQPASIQQFTVDQLNEIPRDVETAVNWLKNRPEADATRIAVVGADLGANIAFISSGTLPQVRAAVSISPQYRENQAQQVLIGTNIPGFQPRNVLFLAAFGDGYAYTSSETMASLTQGATRVIGFQGLDHGMNLLGSDGAWNAVLDWLSQNL